MIRVVSGFGIGWKWGDRHPSKRRFLSEWQAKDAIAECSENEHVPIAFYTVVPCYLLEVQTERGEPTYFDLGSPVEIAR